jgi:predicted PurR-regulated permease PerM
MPGPGSPAVEQRRSGGVTAAEPHPSASDNPAASPVRDAAYVERVVALTLLFVLILGCILVLRAFLPALLWATILVVSTWPIYTRLERATGGRRGLSALVMVLGVALVLLVPVVTLGVHLGESAADITKLVRDTLAAGLPPLPAWIGKLPLVGSRLQEFWDRVASDNAALTAAIQPYVGQGRDALLALGGDLLQGVFQVTVSLFVAFFFYKDGRVTVDMLSQITTRLVGHRSGHLLDVAGGTINGVVQGVLGTALIQAILMAFAFHVAGIPAAMFLGFASFLLSLIPAGLTLLWLPAAIWLSSQGDSGWAIFIVVWGLFVGTIDNWFRPLLIQNRSSELPLALVLLGVLGGALVFGFLGLFLGPVLLALGYSLLREWGSGRAPLRD